MVTAEASWIKPVQIDSAVYYNTRDTAGYIVCYFRDKGPGADFYRFRIRRLSDSNYVKMDYASNDVLFNNQPSAFGSRPNLHKGDTVEVTLYTISEDYYKFYNSAASASQANGNPFAAPAVIESNVTGGTGIFTVLPYSRKIIICK